MTTSKDSQSVQQEINNLYLQLLKLHSLKNTLRSVNPNSKNLIGIELQISTILKKLQQHHSEERILVQIELMQESKSRGLPEMEWITQYAATFAQIWDEMQIYSKEQIAKILYQAPA